MKTNFFKDGREAIVWFLGFEWKSFPQVCSLEELKHQTVSEKVSYVSDVADCIFHRRYTETSVAEADWRNVVCKFINTSLFCGKQ